MLQLAERKPICALVVSGVIILLFGLLYTPGTFGATAADIKVLLIGSYAGGTESWITHQSMMIQNLLEFNGIPYEFFDIECDSLCQSHLDQYDGVVLEGNAMHSCASEAELDLLSQNMESGAITVLLSRIHGEHTDLNSTIYSALGVWVDGTENFEFAIRLRDGAVKIFDYWSEDGFVVVGGQDGRHVAIGVNSLGAWASGDPVFGRYRVYGVELALATWMENAFAIDARVTLPVVSVRLDDTQTTLSERHQEVIDFIEYNKHRIRASGFLVTDASAYQGTDSTLMEDEQTISKWGSMSLHGKDHTPVGAEGENRDYETQQSDLNAAVTFLQEHFSRYKPMKASPMNSWNEATLHTMHDNGIYHHSAFMRASDDYRALYKSLFDVTTDLDRERMYLRGERGLLRYYPLIHCDEHGEARIYSVDWGPVLSSLHSPEQAVDEVRRYGLVWWTPLVVGAHFYHPEPHGANGNPQGWMGVMGALMDSVDHDTYPWRRWVDTYDLAVSLERFDRYLTVDEISVSGDLVTYDITAAQPVRFVTLKAAKAGHAIRSVTIDGTDHHYFGSDYVHLPEIYGSTTIAVSLASPEDCREHVSHIDPSRVIERAGSVGGLLDLELSGEFAVTARIECSSNAFIPGVTRIFDDGTENLAIGSSVGDTCAQVGLRLSPSTGWVEVEVEAWETSGTYYKCWCESAEDSGASVEHKVGDLIPGAFCAVRVDGDTIDSTLADGGGSLTFVYSPGCSVRTFEVIEDSLALAALPGAKPTGGPGGGNSLENRPNPFTAGTEISYHLARTCRVRLSVHSVSGRLVCNLVDGPQVAGTHLVKWDGLDASGSPAAPGIYFCRLCTPHGSVMRKIIMIR